MSFNVSQAQFGRLDSLKGFSDPERAEANAAKMKAAGCDIELVFVESGGHGFLNRGIKDGNEKLSMMKFPLPTQEDVDAAWDRLIGFLGKHLK